MTVADRLEIQDVMLRYAAGVDDRDRGLYRSCFADDVEVVGFGGGTINGADDWVATAWGKLERFETTQHMLGPVLATVTGEQATARTDVQATHYLKQEHGATMTLFATYLSELTKIDGAWKLSRHELVRRGTKTEQADSS